MSYLTSCNLTDCRNVCNSLLGFFPPSVAAASGEANPCGKN